MLKLIADAQTSEEQFLHQIFVRDQMAEWSKNPLLMAKADGVFYWDVHGKRYLGRALRNLHGLGRPQ